MSVEKYDIEFPKTNYQTIYFGIRDKITKDLIKLNDEDLIFMTVKHSPEDEDFKFQKSLQDGITFDEELRKYIIEINTKDTKDLLLNVDYGYDITVYYSGNKPKQKVIGKFKVTDNYTSNEVV